MVAKMQWALFPVWAIVAISLPLACGSGGDNNNNNDCDGCNICPAGKADCVADGGTPDGGNTDGGNADGGDVDGGQPQDDGGTPDGGSQLDVALLRAVFNGRYGFMDPQGGGLKTTNVEVRVCESVLYPQTEVCLFSTALGGTELGILPDWSMMVCYAPLTADGQCPAESEGYAVALPFLCDCQALTTISGAAAGAECERRQDPPREECNPRGGVVFDLDIYSKDDLPGHPYYHIAHWKFLHQQ